MEATVYRTRQRGVRLAVPTPGVHGHLQLAIWRTRDSMRQFAARLTPADGEADLIPELLGARVQRITKNGIVISGLEVIARRSSSKSGADRYSQTWWCRVHTVARWEPTGPFPP
jgi:hypothetical protein